MKKLFFLFISITFFFALVLLPLVSGEVSIIMKDCIKTSLYTLTPSLFPFIFLSTFLSAFSGDLLSRLCAPILCPALGISTKGVKAVILGLLGGFPQGANITASLYSQGEIQKDEAERLVIFSNNAGLMFVISLVGGLHFASFKVGVLLYLVHIASSLFLGVLTREKHQYSFKKEKYVIPKKLDFASTFSSSIKKSANVMGIISLNFIVFSVFSSLLGKILPEGNISAAFSGLFEITGGIFSLSKDYTGIVIASFLLGFSGLSVHMQSYNAFNKAKLSLKKCLLWHFLRGLLSAFLAFLIFPSDMSLAHSYPPFIFYVALILTPLIFLIPVKKKKVSVF